jgi:hypothetical protein
MKNIRIRIRFLDPILGMSPSDENLYLKYIASKNPDPDFDPADELEAIIGEESSTITVFPRNNAGEPCFFDYQLRGFFKESCSMLARSNGVDENGKKSRKKAVTLSGMETAYKKLVDGNIFVYPRKVPICYEGDMSLCQRPLRASTPQGERITLACSEEIPEGAVIEFDVKIMRDHDVDLVAEWMAYGEYHGMGQWRNSGKGRFMVEKFVVTDEGMISPRFEVQYA